MTVCSLSSCRILAPDHPHPRPELRTVADPTSPPPGADSPPRPLLRRKETQLAQRGLNHQPLPMEPQGVWGRGPAPCLSVSFLHPGGTQRRGQHGSGHWQKGGREVP